MPEYVRQGSCRSFAPPNGISVFIVRPEEIQDFSVDPINGNFRWKAIGAWCINEVREVKSHDP